MGPCHTPRGKHISQAIDRNPKVPARGPAGGELRVPTSLEELSLLSGLVMAWKLSCGTPQWFLSILHLPCDAAGQHSVTVFFISGLS